jgi:hypothetical protein
LDDTRRNGGSGAHGSETFDFLGFTHICGKMRKTGKFLAQRKSVTKRLRAKLQAVKAELHRRWHDPVPEVGAWLRRVVQGWFNYHAVPGNGPSLVRFRSQVAWLWLRTLRRRSQRGRMTWAQFALLADSWLPRVRILHPSSASRFDAKHPR